jgi:hypothetical protein
VSHDHKWLAVIYSVSTEAFVAVFSIDSYGDLTPAATSSHIGVASFNGVANSHSRLTRSLIPFGPARNSLLAGSNLTRTSIYMWAAKYGDEPAFKFTDERLLGPGGTYSFFFQNAHKPRLAASSCRW